MLSIQPTVTSADRWVPRGSALRRDGPHMFLVADISIKLSALACAPAGYSDSTDESFAKGSPTGTF